MSSAFFGLTMRSAFSPPTKLATLPHLPSGKLRLVQPAVFSGFPLEGRLRQSGRAQSPLPGWRKRKFPVYYCDAACRNLSQRCSHSWKGVSCFCITCWSCCCRRRRQGCDQSSLLQACMGKGGGTYHSLADGKSGVLCDPPPQKNIWAWFAFRSKPVGLNSLCRWSQRGQDCSLNWADHAKQSWFEPANCNSVGVSKRQGRCRLSKGGRELARGEQQRLCIYSVKMASPVHRSAPSPFHPCNSHKAIKGNDSFNQQQKPGGGGCLHIWGFRIIGLTLG